MKDLTFNRVLERNHKGAKRKVPCVKFRKLKKIGKVDRYQGGLLANGIDMISTINPDFDYIQVVFSDEHLIVGLKPVGNSGKKNKCFGVTQLMDFFDIKLGFEYELKSNGEVVYFNTAQKPVKE